MSGSAPTGSITLKQTLLGGVGPGTTGALVAVGVRIEPVFSGFARVKPHATAGCGVYATLSGCPVVKPK